MNDLNQYPHSPIAEKAVLAGILNNPDMLADAHMLEDGHFHLPGPRIVYQTMFLHVGSAKPLDIRLLIQTMLDNGTLTSAGGPSILAEIQSYAVDVFSWSHHLETLIDRKARRMAIKAANDIIEAAYQTDSPSELIEATSAPITAVHDTLLATKPSESKRAVMDAVLGQLHAMLEGKKSPMGIETKLPIIDKKFLGLHPHRTTIISGYPSGGKSVLAGQLCAEAFKQEHNTLFVSLEMGKAQLMQRMIAYVGGLPGKAITNPKEYASELTGIFNSKMTNADMLKIQNASMTIMQAPFEIEHMLGATEHTIAVIIRKHHRKKALNLVVVDFAQRIRPSKELKAQNREQQLSMASKVLADLAQELGFHMILCSQLNKEGAAKHAEALNEDCDLHLQILQHKETKEHMGIGVPKDRHNGQCGTMLPIMLNEQHIRFEEQTRKDDPNA